jgi:hypothetical protein
VRVFKNLVQRNIFGPKREYVTGDWRNCIMTSFMHCTPHQIVLVIKLRMGWGGHVACMDRKRNAYIDLVGESERKRPLKRFRCRLEGMFKMDLEEI